MKGHHMRLLLALLVLTAADVHPAFAQAGLPGPLVDVGFDAVATASATAGGIAWSPRVTLNPTPDLAVTFRGSAITDDRRSYRRQATTIEAEVHHQMAHLGALAVDGIVGAGLRHKREFRPDYAFDPATGQFGQVSDYIDRYRPAGHFGAGVVERVGRRAELRQDVRVGLHADGIDMSLAMGITLPLGTYITRPADQSAQVGRSRLRTGQRVWITQDDGSTIDGQVGDITAAAIEVLQPSGRASVDMARVRRVAIPDSIRNGARLGAIVGGIGLGTYGVFIARSLCECRDDSSLVVAMAFAGLGTGGGALIGAIVDSFHVGRRTILDRDASASVTVAPMLTRSRAGAMATIRW
jgi:hypothetical protein